MAEGPEYRQAARVQAELNEQTRLLAQARVSAAKAERAGQRRLEAEQQQRLIVEKQLQELQEQQAVAAVVELAVSEPDATNTAAVLQGELRGLRITSETRSVQFRKLDAAKMSVERENSYLRGQIKRMQVVSEAHAERQSQQRQEQLREGSGARQAECDMVKPVPAPVQMGVMMGSPQKECVLQPHGGIRRFGSSIQRTYQR